MAEEQEILNGFTAQPAGSAAALIAAAPPDLRDDDREAPLTALGEAAAAGDGYLPMHFVTALVSWHRGDIAKALTLARAGDGRAA